MTKDKTVTMSRELVERAAHAIEKHHSSLSWVIASEIRALLDAPVVEPTLAEYCKQCADTVQTWPESKRDCLGKIAAPVVERQEPVAWRYQSCAGGLWYLSSSEHNARTFQCNGLEGGVEPLYTSPPAPVAVVLPECREPSSDNPYLNVADHEWNACLDKVKELNQ